MKQYNLRFLVPNLFFALIFLLHSDLVVAQGSEPVIRSDADYTFGQMMRFHLIIENLDNIQSVTLFFRAPEFPNTFTVNVSFEPGDGIEAKHQVDLTQVRLAPFTAVTYWWMLTTYAGEDIMVPEQSIAYDDTQFDWRQLRQGQLSVYWTGDDPGLGQLALDILDETFPRLRAFIPGMERMPFRLYIYPSSADLRSALRLTGRDWVGAHADPELGVILVTAVNQRTAATDLRQSIPHEVAHFLLYQAVESNYGALPLWFNEGVATHVESTSNPGYQVMLQTAIARQTTIPFSELCHRFPALEERALLAYAQSESMISFIRDRYGNQKLSDMIRAFADGADCQSGVSRELQTTLSELDEAWLRSQQPQSPIIQLLSEHSLPLLLIIGGFAISQLLVLKPITRRGM